MPKRLNGSAGTGKKIMTNLNIFNYRYDTKDGDIYRFSWTFGNQSGNAAIALNDDDSISQSSRLNCETNKCDFVSSLGAYNDPTLYNVFKMMLDSQNILHK